MKVSLQWTEIDCDNDPYRLPLIDEHCIINLATVSETFSETISVDLYRSVQYCRFYYYVCQFMILFNVLQYVQNILNHSKQPFRGLLKVLFINHRQDKPPVDNREFTAYV